MLTIGSLFSGYGGLDMAIESVLPARTAWVSDIDPGACKVLAHRYPDVPNLGDITTIDWAGVEPVDIITGGYPCQPFSTAGRRLGQEDDRHLWPYVRDALAVMRPTFAVFENVRGHLSLGFDEVVRDLHQLGYDIEWRIIRASDIGACHQRARLFILGVNRERRVRSRLDRRGGLHRDSADRRELSSPAQGQHDGQGNACPHGPGEALWGTSNSGQNGNSDEPRLPHMGAHGGGCEPCHLQASTPVPGEGGGGRRRDGVRRDASSGPASVESPAGMEQRDARACRDAQAPHSGGEPTWTGSDTPGVAGCCADCGLPLGLVVGAGGEPVRPGGVRGAVPDERGDDLGARVRTASGSDVLAWRRDLMAPDANGSGRSKQRRALPAKEEHAAVECSCYDSGRCRRTYDLSARRTTSETVSPLADVACCAAAQSSSSIRTERSFSPYRGDGSAIGGDAVTVGHDLADSGLSVLDGFGVDVADHLAPHAGEPAEKVAVAEAEAGCADVGARANHLVVALDEAGGPEASEPSLVEGVEVGDELGVGFGGVHGSRLNPVHTDVNTDTDLTLLPTPHATDGTKGGPNQRGSSGDLMLPSAVVQLLPTPVSDNSRGLPSEGTDFQSLPNEVVHRWGQYAAAIARHEHMLGRPAPSPVEPGRNGKPRLSAEFASWMMGLPDGWITDTPGVTRNEALKLCGNGVVPHQAAAALADMLAAMRQAVAA